MYRSKLGHSWNHAKLTRRERTRERAPGETSYELPKRMRRASQILTATHNLKPSPRLEPARPPRISRLPILDALCEPRRNLAPGFVDRPKNTALDKNEVFRSMCDLSDYVKKELEDEMTELDGDIMDLASGSTKFNVDPTLPVSPTNNPGKTKGGLILGQLMYAMTALNQGIINAHDYPPEFIWVLKHQTILLQRHLQLMIEKKFVLLMWLQPDPCIRAKDIDRSVARMLDRGDRCCQLWRVNYDVITEENGDVTLECFTEVTDKMLISVEAKIDEDYKYVLNGIVACENSLTELIEGRERKKWVSRRHSWHEMVREAEEEET